MISKITKRENCHSIITYILNDKKKAYILWSKGVNTTNKNSIIDSMIIQGMMNDRVKNKIGHISLAFSPEDSSKLSDDLMLKIAQDYLYRMKIENTQILIGKHNDKRHPHLHIAFNRINNEGKCISDKNDRFRSTKICKQISLKYNLYISSGKRNVNFDRLKEPDKTKYEIYKETKQALATSMNWNYFLLRLALNNIEVKFKRDKCNNKEGIIFKKNGFSFKGSKIDRELSFTKIDAYFSKLNQEECSKLYYLSHHDDNIDTKNEENKLHSDSSFIEGLFPELGTIGGTNNCKKKKRKY